MKGLCAAAAAAIWPAAAAAQVSFGQLDDFEDGTVMGWEHGFSSPVPPTNMPSGGPAGEGDAYLHNVSFGGIGSGSRQVIRNLAQWTGNFASAGVRRVSGMIANLGATDVYMRVAVRGGTVGTQFGSTQPIHLPSGSGWTPVAFDLTPSAMSVILGTETLQDVLSNVTEFRLLSAQNVPFFMGDQIVATVGFDNLRAMALPGDATLDGSVNLADFNVLAGNFGTAGGATWQQADFNFDGIVNLADFNLLAGNFGISAGATAGPTSQDWSNLAAAVPEPAGLVGIAGLAAPMLGRRRCQRGQMPVGLRLR